MASRSGSILMVVASTTLGVTAVLSLHGSVRNQQSTLSTVTQTSTPVQATPSVSEIATADRKATQQIRRSILAERGLSLYAHNCFILTRAGDVTLKGVVRTSGERQKVEALASDVVGPSHVHDNLTIVSARGVTALPRLSSMTFR